MAEDGNLATKRHKKLKKILLILYFLVATSLSVASFSIKFKSETDTAARPLPQARRRKILSKRNYGFLSSFSVPNRELTSFSTFVPGLQYLHCKTKLNSAVPESRCPTRTLKSGLREFHRPSLQVWSAKNLTVYKRLQFLCIIEKSCKRDLFF